MGGCNIASGRESQARTGNLATVLHGVFPMLTCVLLGSRAATLCHARDPFLLEHFSSSAHDTLDSEFASGSRGTLPSAGTWEAIQSRTAFQNPSPGSRNRALTHRGGAREAD